MDLTQWSHLALICIMGAMSPGPSLAIVLRNTVSGGRTQGMFTGIGHGLGITFYSVVAITGLVTIFKTIPHFFLIAQIAGSFFLIWLGANMIISAISSAQSNNKENKPKVSAHRGFFEGFLIAFLNPKIAAWTLALFSQFVQPEATFKEHLLLVSTVGGIDATWYCLVATLASSKGLVNGLRSSEKRINLGMGLLLVFLAAGMLYRVIPFLA